MELYLEPIRLNNNPTNGRFIKNRIPHNKGKKWNNWLSETEQKKILKNLTHQGNANIGKYQGEKIVGIKNGKFHGVFDHSNEAGIKLNLCSRNIRSCCHGKRKSCGGINWFYEKDFEKWNQLIV
jgi:hypothetical protein